MEAQVVNLKERVKALDQQVLEGKILEAVEAFFHPDVVTKEGNGSETHGLAEIQEKLQNFFQGISSVNEIRLHSQTVGDEVTMSEFTFDLTQTDGSPILWNEVLRRKWKDGLVINERYYTAN
ncbi:MAG: nuclear transport factor 2 family protein [Cyclobacteriaceae bacterium]